MGPDLYFNSEVSKNQCKIKTRNFIFRFEENWELIIYVDSGKNLIWTKTKSKGDAISRDGKTDCFN